MKKGDSTLKEQATELRQQGYSYGYITQKLNVPKSTLSGWLKDVKLTKTQKKKLKDKSLKALAQARKKAIKAHKKAKEKRLKKIRKEAAQFVDELNLNKKNLELFLAALYLADGDKREAITALSSSDPKIALGFISLLRKIYKIDEAKIRAAIYARADQDSRALIPFWSRLLKIPKTHFHKTQIDKRTAGKPTYPHYKGVCAIYYYDSCIQRRLLSIAKILIEKTEK